MKRFGLYERLGDHKTKRHHIDDFANINSCFAIAVYTEMDDFAILDRVTKMETIYNEDDIEAWLDGLE